MTPPAAGASYGELLVTSLIVLVVVCVAAFVAVRVFGRWLATGRTRGAHLMNVVARVPLEPRRSLYVVAVAGKTLLVGTSEMGLSLLSELDAQEVAARQPVTTSFGEVVRAAWQRRKGLARAPASNARPAGDRELAEREVSELLAPSAASRSGPLRGNGENGDRSWAVANWRGTPVRLPAAAEPREKGDPSRAAADLRREAESPPAAGDSHGAGPWRIARDRRPGQGAP